MDGWERKKEWVNEKVRNRNLLVKETHLIHFSSSNPVHLIDITVLPLPKCSNSSWLVWLLKKWFKYDHSNSFNTTLQYIPLFPPTNWCTLDFHLDPAYVPPYKQVRRVLICKWYAETIIVSKRCVLSNLICWVETLSIFLFF